MLPRYWNRKSIQVRERQRHYARLFEDGKSIVHNPRTAPVWTNNWIDFLKILFRDKIFKSASNIIWASSKVMHFCKIWKALLKNWARHALFNFKTFWQEIQIWVHLESSNFVKSCLLLRSLIGKNLALISQTTSDLFKNNQFCLDTLGLVLIKLTRNWLETINTGPKMSRQNWLFLN